MSRENVEILRREFPGFIAGLERGDPGAAFDASSFAEDVEFYPSAGFPGPAVYRGRDGFILYMTTWVEAFEDWSLRLEGLIDSGDDRVVALLHQRATGKRGGVPVELHMAVIYELSEGQVIRSHNYLDPAEALEDVGLREEDLKPAE